MRSLVHLAAVTLASGIVASSIDAAAQERPTLRAHPRGAAEIELDGRLDEPVWREAEVSTSFTERTPAHGARARVSHELRVIYDEDAIYVGVRVGRTEGAELAANELIRDSWRIWADDSVTVKL